MWGRLTSTGSTRNSDNNNDSTSSSETPVGRREKAKTQRAFGGLLSYDGLRKNAKTKEGSKSLNKEENVASKSPSQREPKSNNDIHSGSRRSSGIFSLMRGSGSFTNADLERKVSQSARNLFDGVKKIIAAAKQGGSSTSSQDIDEWKIQLLDLLCGNFGEPKASQEGKKIGFRYFASK